MSLYPPYELRSALIALNIVREPDVAGTLPACWINVLDPYGPDGSPSEPVTVTILDEGGFGGAPGLGAVERLTVRIDIRSQNPAQADQLARDLVTALDDKHALPLGSMRAEHSRFLTYPSVIPNQLQGSLRTMRLLLVVHKSQIG